MLRRAYGLNEPWIGPAPKSARLLQRDGHLVLRGVFTATEVQALRSEIEEVYDSVPPDLRAGRPSPDNAAMFRYQMFNRSARAQDAIAHPRILEAVEPLLGDDCHAISCTAWRNPPGPEHSPHGLEWHVDGGPHVPRLRGVRWPKLIPYPVFVIATHVYLRSVRLEDGPTAVVPGSHTSGRVPPESRKWDLDLRYRGRSAEVHVAEPGDVGFFVSDVWHRRYPPQEDARGRFFLQTNYGRRDIAQRILPSDDVNHTTPESRARADTPRKRRLIGLHEQRYYDS